MKTIEQLQLENAALERENRDLRVRLRLAFDVEREHREAMQEAASAAETTWCQQRCKLAEVLERTSLPIDRGSVWLECDPKTKPEGIVHGFEAEENEAVAVLLNGIPAEGGSASKAMFEKLIRMAFQGGLSAVMDRSQTSGSSSRVFTAEEVRPLVEALKLASAALLKHHGCYPMSLCPPEYRWKFEAQSTVDEAIAHARKLGMDNEP